VSYGTGIAGNSAATSRRETWLATCVIEVEELPIPEAVGAPGWADFESAVGIHYGNEALTYGTDELAFTAEEALPYLLDQDNTPTRVFAARDGERMVGSARYEREASDDSHTAWLTLDVLPGARRRGVGAALSATLEAVCAEDGSRKAIVYAVSGYAAGERIASPTGFGSVPADNAEVRFLLTSGYRLEQVVRTSRLALPLDVTGMLAHAGARSGSTFALHSWVDRTPTEWLGELAALRQAMSTEAPSAGLEEPEDIWTIERLVAEEERLAASPRTILVTAVEHVPSGSLAGFTALIVPRELDRSVAQGDTLVLPEHRGNQLGMLLKVGNLDFLERRSPGHPAIITFNAEENRHMLDVNEALGFVPIGYEGAWRKDLHN
jgi:GNAT superfamily N-acetyltransferase